MTDDDFDKVDEDFASEFDFVDNNGSAKTATEKDGATTSSTPPTKGSPLITLMVIISILGGGYYGYSHFFASATPDKEPITKPEIASNELPTLPVHADPNAIPPVTANPNEVAEQLQNKTNSELSAASLMSEKSFEQVQKELHSAQQTTQAATPPNAVPMEVRAALQNIAEEMTQNVNNINNLEGTIANIATTLEHLNKTITAMDNRILSLTETVDGLSQDLSNVKKVMTDQDMDLTSPGSVKFSSKKQNQSISNSEPNYTVHAIIPGRAWLKSSSGQILTITEGDKLGNYGTVAVIDSANGLVRTSSGIIIR